MGDRIIDWASLLDICGEEDMVEELVEASVEDAMECMALLNQAVLTKDLETIELYAHRLKGVSMVMGAATLTPLAYALEQAGNEDRLEDVSGLLAPIQETFDQVSAFLSQDNWIEMAKQLDSSPQDAIRGEI
jgi:HPt (histidine-containing phosphotransfer) domain-containing protein